MSVITARVKPAMARCSRVRIGRVGGAAVAHQSDAGVIWKLLRRLGFNRFKRIDPIDVDHRLAAASDRRFGQGDSCPAIFIAAPQHGDGCPSQVNAMADGEGHDNHTCRSTPQKRWFLAQRF